jgi:hypothetical protein
VASKLIVVKRLSGCLIRAAQLHAKVPCQPDEVGPMIRQRAYKRKPRLTVIPRDHNSRWVNASIKKGGRVYAICFDLEIELLKEHYPNQSYNNAYADIRAAEDHRTLVGPQ